MSKFPGHPLFDTAEHLPDQLERLEDYPSLSEFLSGLPETAFKDWQQSAQFLQRHTGSPGAFSRFRGEVQRFLNWLWLVQGKTLVEVTGDDLDAYAKFVKRPPAAWITREGAKDNESPVKGSGRQRSFVSANGLRVANPYWRPFVWSNVGLKKASIKSFVAILSSYFKKLVSAGYLPHSPISDMSKQSKKVRSRKADSSQKSNDKSEIEQRAPRMTLWQWIYLHDALVDAADKDDRYERHLFVVVTMKTFYLRVFELAPHGEKHGSYDYDHEPVMGHFSQVVKDGTKYWHLFIHGKGDESRHIPVPDSYMPYLKRYRAYRNLPPYPARGELKPMIVRADKKTALYSKRSVERLVEASMGLAIQKLEAEGNLDEAAKFRQFQKVTHILRHTGASIDIEMGRPLRNVSEDLGHKSPAFTEQIYVHSDSAERYYTGFKRAVV
ncbi:hypothetical protein AWH63_10450 [Marinobacter sp. C18]|uniref:tyrosine-type recombinase/integrase n=1 Tax=Marinobacter sp. C18 TaxID=1772288 RepID=UPI000948DE3E|nr:site-specific integrase [Marinobacter sp. C18]OLF81951.1 hypothetical protein AWH63_10450 [Marinobacter sp. C18]